MSYDMYWDCPSLDSKTWIKYLSWNELPDRPFAVSVSHGQVCAVDELYLFSSLEDALRFYSKDVKGRQYKIDGRPIGLRNISLIETTHDIVLAERKISAQRRRSHRSSGRRMSTVNHG